MALTTWTRDYGVTQGRLDPSGWTPTSGDFAFVLGSDISKRLETLNIGDYIEASQLGDLPNFAALLRVSVYLRPPTTMPSGVAWKLSLRIDGVEYSRTLIRPGLARRRIDLAANVMHLATGGPGLHVVPRTVALRLELAVG